MSLPLYGSKAFREASGDTLRPGGLKLTAYGLDLMRKAGLPEGASVLDCGCGPGATAACVAKQGYRAWGVDWHPGPFALGGAAGTGEENAEATLVCGDILSLPFCDGAFDACLAECVLSLTADLGKALRDIFRVLAPGGLFLVTDLTLRRGTAVPPDGPFMERGQSCMAGALTFPGWEEALAGAGFDVIFHEDVSHALAQFAARLVWYDAAGELGCLLPGGQCSPGGVKCFGYGIFLARKPV